MGISEQKAIDIATDKVRKLRSLEPEEFEVKSTYCASGRWKIKFDVDNGDEIGVRLDSSSGKLAEKEGHSKTSWNLVP
jgi:hypothetical protein